MKNWFLPLRSSFHEGRNDDRVSECLYVLDVILASFMYITSYNPQNNLREYFIFSTLLMRNLGLRETQWHVQGLTASKLREQGFEPRSFDF